MDLIEKKSQLLDYLAGIGYNKEYYRIAVEALIFTSEGKLLLEERGPACRDEIGKLEGVGGQLHRDDLLQELREEFDQELGAQEQELEIDIERLLEIRQVQFEEQDKGLQHWVVVSHLCRIRQGKPVIGEKDKIASLHEISMEELYKMEEGKLSNSTIAARKVYQALYGNRPYYEVPEPVEKP